MTSKSIRDTPKVDQPHIQGGAKEFHRWCCAHIGKRTVNQPTPVLRGIYANSTGISRKRPLNGLHVGDAHAINGRHCWDEGVGQLIRQGTLWGSSDSRADLTEERYGQRTGRLPSTLVGVWGRAGACFRGVAQRKRRDHTWWQARQLPGSRPLPARAEWSHDRLERPVTPSEWPVDVNRGSPNS